MSDINEWLKERRRIHDAATSGAWTASIADLSDPLDATIIDSDECEGMWIASSDDDTRAPENAYAIADAHNTLPALLTAVEKVLELHGPVAPDVEGDRPHCHLCGYWPCDTYRAIEGAINDG